MLFPLAVPVHLIAMNGPWTEIMRGEVSIFGDTKEHDTFPAARPRGALRVNNLG